MLPIPEFCPIRYPHYGGRRRPAECCICERFVLCWVVDTDDGTGEALCAACIKESIELAWRVEVKRRNGLSATP